MKIDKPQGASTQKDAKGSILLQSWLPTTFAYWQNTPQVPAIMHIELA